MIGAVVVAALAAAWRYTPLSELITAQKVIDWARAAREMPWAAAVVIVAYTPAAFLMFPRPLLTLLTVIAFGPWLGFVYSIGTFLGMLPGVLATTVFGDQIAMALEDPSRINYWLVGAVAAALVVLTYFVRRWFSKQGMPVKKQLHG